MIIETIQIFIDTQRTSGEISPLLFGGFAEHMGRCIYEGIYEPGSPLADEAGLRTDVLAALREQCYTIMCYPGGNFVSGYNWLDGVGPKAQRPRRRELAWQSIESNQFGTNEFIHFCRQLDTLPMLAVNLGTGTIQAAADLVEYCNAPTGTHFADLRAGHGYPQPHNVQYWCLGNEVDGPWQIGHQNAVSYGRKALEAAKMMRWHDPALKLVLCGSSSDQMPTYPEWDRTVLELAWEQVDCISLHLYPGNHDNDSASYFASAARFENYIEVLSIHAGRQSCARAIARFGCASAPDRNRQIWRCPQLDVAATFDEASNSQAIFIVNRSQTAAANTAIIWQNAAPRQVQESWQLTGTDVKAVNSWAQPNLLTARSIANPPVEEDRLMINLPPLSFTVLRLG